jgi:hypothetical protein
MEAHTHLEGMALIQKEGRDGTWHIVLLIFLPMLREGIGHWTNSILSFSWLYFFAFTFPSESLYPAVNLNSRTTGLINKYLYDQGPKLTLSNGDLCRTNCPSNEGNSIRQ